MSPIAVDLFCGLGGFSKGFIAEGYRAIGFDIERHDYGTGGYPGELVLQDVLTLHGSQFKDAACIVASPPCQEFSYMAMPWKRAKQIAAALRGDHDPSGLSVPFPEGYTGSEARAQLTALFDACFRIQREASEAAGHHIPMVVENVKGAQPWVGRANANYGSFYLWGDVRSVGGRIVAAHRVEFGAPGVKAMRDLKGWGGTWFHNAETGRGNPNRDRTATPPDGRKVPMNFHEHEKTGKPGRSFQSAAVESVKVGVGDGYQRARRPHLTNPEERNGEKQATSARKAASAQIAKIPFELSAYIARAFKPESTERVA